MATNNNQRKFQNQLAVIRELRQRRQLGQALKQRQQQNQVAQERSAVDRMKLAIAFGRDPFSGEQLSAGQFNPFTGAQQPGQFNPRTGFFVPSGQARDEQFMGFLPELQESGKLNVNEQGQLQFDITGQGDFVPIGADIGQGGRVTNVRTQQPPGGVETGIAELVSRARGQGGQGQAPSRQPQQRPGAGTAVRTAGGRQSGRQNGTQPQAGQALTQDQYQRSLQILQQGSQLMNQIPQTGAQQGQLSARSQRMLQTQIAQLLDIVEDDTQPPKARQIALAQVNELRRRFE